MIHEKKIKMEQNQEQKLSSNERGGKGTKKEKNGGERVVLRERGD